MLYKHTPTHLHTLSLTHTRADKEGADRYRHRGRRVALGQGADKSVASWLPVIG